MKHQKNNFCKCGHLEIEHEERTYFKYPPKGKCHSCATIAWSKDPNVLAPYVYHSFKQDNLKYLEMLYEAKTKES